MEKFTGVRLKLIPDIEKEQLVESMIRGGNFIIFKGYAGANKKVLKLRGPNKPTFYSIYLNANNLYGHSIWFKLFFPEKINFDIYGGDGS